MGLFSSIASAVGSIAGAGLGYLGARERNASAEGAASDQMAFQERMFDSRYQKQMRDMRRAGLNPILSYGSAPPAAPTGASWDPINVAADAGKAIGEAVPQAIGAASAYQGYKNLKATNAQIQANTAALKSSAAKNYADANFKMAQTTTEGKRPDQIVAETARASSGAELNRAQTAVTKINALINEANLDVAQKQALVAGIEAEVYKTTIGEIVKWGQTLGLSPGLAKALAGWIKSGGDLLKGGGKSGQGNLFRP